MYTPAGHCIRHSRHTLSGTQIRSIVQTTSLDSYCKSFHGVNIPHRDLIKNTTQFKRLSAETRLDQNSKLKIQNQLRKYHDGGAHKEKINLADLAKSWIYKLDSRDCLSQQLRVKKEELKKELDHIPINFEKLKLLLDQILLKDGSEQEYSNLPTEKI